MKELRDLKDWTGHDVQPAPGARRERVGKERHVMRLNLTEGHYFVEFTLLE